MYVSEELWPLCRTDVFISVPLSQNKNSIGYKVISAEKNNMQSQKIGMRRKKKIITEYTHCRQGDADGDNIAGDRLGLVQNILPCHPLVPKIALVFSPLVARCLPSGFRRQDGKVVTEQLRGR